MELLQSGCDELGVSLSAKQVDQFQRYYELLVDWNSRMNLTTIDAYDDVQTKHFLDSLTALPLIAEEMGHPIPPPVPQSAIDVGSGAGFPGIPLKIAWPDLRLTLLDGTGKKVRFMQTVVDELGLDGVRIVQGRAEEVGLQDDFREQFDLVTARVVARLNTLVEYLLPLNAVGGYTIVFKGPSAAEEFMEAGRAIGLLGGETVRFAPVRVPHLDEERRVLLLKKTTATPKSYPRQRGLPRKEPL